MGPYITGKTGQRIVSWIKYYFLLWPHFVFVRYVQLGNLLQVALAWAGKIQERGHRGAGCHAPLAVKPAKLATFLRWFRWHFKASYNKAVAMNRSWYWTSLCFFQLSFQQFLNRHLTSFEPFLPFLYIDIYLISILFGSGANDSF